jgi:MFS transporter, FLVCR family, MFS-domain-containing protein 7
MQRNLWFQAGFAIAVVPLPLSMGLFGRANKVRLRRVEADKASSATGVVTDNMANDTAVAP